MSNVLDSKIPEGPLKDKWTDYKSHVDLVNPANKRSIDVIIVGTGLAGGSAAALRGLCAGRGATDRRTAGPNSGSERKNLAAGDQIRGKPPGPAERTLGRGGLGR